MSAREEILAGIRAALSGATEPPPVPRGYRRPEPEAPSIDLFIDRVEDYRAVVTRCSADGVVVAVQAVLPEGARVIVPVDLPYAIPGAVPDSGQSAAELDAVDAVVTTATVGIATTGTIVLTHGSGEGRRALSLVPDLHICVVRTDQIVDSVCAALEQLNPVQPTTWISGPSATSDIELERVEGVHGPRTLHVLLVTT